MNFWKNVPNFINIELATSYQTSFQSDKVDSVTIGPHLSFTKIVDSVLRMEYKSPNNLLFTKDELLTVVLLYRDKPNALELIKSRHIRVM
jgi:hypothetical protein